MTVDEALTNADDWTKGHMFYERQTGWRIAIAVFAAEVRRLRQHGAITALDKEVKNLRREGEV